MATSTRREWKCLTCGQIQWKGKEGAHNSSTCKRKAKRKRDEEDIKEQMVIVDKFCESDDLVIKSFAIKQKTLLSTLVDERANLLEQVKSYRSRLTYQTGQVGHYQLIYELERGKTERLELEKSEINEAAATEKKLMMDKFEQQKTSMRKVYYDNKNEQIRNHQKAIDELIRNHQKEINKVRRERVSEIAKLQSELSAQKEVISQLALSGRLSSF